MIKEIHRCVVCDRTDAHDMSLSQEGSYGGWYKRDKLTGGYICNKCSAAVYENLRDLNQVDEDV